ncbi:hypothetical protein H320_13505 [Vibrio parahaemolyticus 49]|uniref:hypothetical protein n=1 Tax=Vibrio harveyi group TaxID=717610 RepID=UPI0005B70955|nr:MULTISPECIES: hypothetical protein [Vibrio harveyi group]KIT43409.1 hypothetical protein H320_13505 [Vibrio parahaemolyticus 49]EGQ8731265.1 hypothetical protein [Vibrio parahaemolyticus]EGQ8883719.1 hypothetical protein [Vibrio parahaemolyticus]EGQ8913955.1 hypothetical protein [Vibrio parahaemolyticus]EGQ8933670.1 hypothetical protein [Vibrio parahaemolyticus]
MLTGKIRNQIDEVWRKVTDNHGESAYGFFDEGTVVELFGVIRKVNANAMVAESQSA